jgi:hypothetical protein
LNWEIIIDPALTRRTICSVGGASLPERKLDCIGALAGSSHEFWKKQTKESNHRRQRPGS